MKQNETARKLDVSLVRRVGGIKVRSGITAGMANPIPAGKVKPVPANL